MKHLLLAVAALTVVACSKPAQDETIQRDSAAAAAPDSTDFSGELRAATAKYFDAVASGDTVAMDAILAPSAVTVQGDAKIVNRAQRMAGHKAGHVKFSGPVANEILLVQPYGDDFGLVQVRATTPGELKGQKWGPAAVLVLAFARTDGGPWQLVYLQVVPEKVAAPKT